MRIKVFYCVTLALIFYIGDRNFHMISLPLVKALNLTTTKNTVKFILYKTKLSGINIIGNNYSSIDTSPWKNHFVPSAETKVITHGWTTSSNSHEVQLIKNEYLKYGNHNIIALDWSNFSNMQYLEAIKQINMIGKVLAKMIQTLIHKNGANSKRFHLIGFSLGAHIMGIAGGFSQYPIGRITALDPARPVIENAEPLERLDAEDAEFVDVIHTCAYILGIGDPIGHADFYPNRGVATQPGCWKFGNPIICSHSRSYEFFAESINSRTGFYALFCSSWEAFQSKSECDGAVLMGDTTSTSTRGVFYLETNSRSPFAKGPI